jgi:hypothetical protein
MTVKQKSTKALAPPRSWATRSHQGCRVSFLDLAYMLSNRYIMTVLPLEEVGHGNASQVGTTPQMFYTS